MPARDRFDPVSIEVMWTRLISAIDEAALTLHRTSFSTVVRESFDYSCMVLGPEGQSVAQATRSIPSLIGTLPMSVRAYLKVFPAETLKPGDVLTFVQARHVRVVDVLELGRRRGPAVEAQTLYHDRSPDPDPPDASRPVRTGAGRPTKKDRRDLEKSRRRHLD